MGSSFAGFEPKRSPSVASSVHNTQTSAALYLPPLEVVGFLSLPLTFYTVPVPASPETQTSQLRSTEDVYDHKSILLESVRGYRNVTSHLILR